MFFYLKKITKWKKKLLNVVLGLFLISSIVIGLKIVKIKQVYFEEEQPLVSSQTTTRPCTHSEKNILEKIHKYDAKIQKYNIKLIEIQNEKIALEGLTKIQCPENKDENIKINNAIIEKLKKIIQNQEEFINKLETKIYQKETNDATIASWKKSQIKLKKWQKHLKGANFNIIEEIDLQPLLQNLNNLNPGNATKEALTKLWETIKPQNYMTNAISEKIWKLFKAEKKLDLNKLKNIRVPYLIVEEVEYLFNFVDLLNKLKKEYIWSKLEKKLKQDLLLIAEIGYDHYFSKLKILLDKATNGYKRMIMVPIHEAGHALIAIVVQQEKKFIINSSVTIETSKNWNINGLQGSIWKKLFYKKFAELKTLKEKAEWIEMQKYSLMKALAGEMIVAQLDYFKEVGKTFDYLKWWKDANEYSGGDLGKVYKTVKKIAAATGKTSENILKEAHQETQKLLTKHKEKILRIAYLLWITKHVSNKELIQIYNKDSWHSWHQKLIENNLLPKIKYDKEWYKKVAKEYYLSKTELIWNSIENQWEELIKAKIIKIKGIDITNILLYIKNHNYSLNNKTINDNQFAYSSFIRNYIKLQIVNEHYKKIENFLVDAALKKEFVELSQQLIKEKISFANLLAKVQKELFALTKVISINEIETFQDSIKTDLDAKTTNSLSTNLPKQEAFSSKKIWQEMITNAESKWETDEDSSLFCASYWENSEKAIKQPQNITAFILDCLVYYPYLFIDDEYSTEKKVTLEENFPISSFWKKINSLIDKEKNLAIVWEKFQKEFLTKVKKAKISILKKIEFDLLTNNTDHTTSYYELDLTQKKQWENLLKNQNWEIDLREKIAKIEFWMAIKEDLAKLDQYKIATVNKKSIFYLIKERENRYDKLSKEAKKELAALQEDKNIKAKIQELLSKQTKSPSTQKWILPTLIAAGTLAGILLLGGIVYAVKKKRKRKS